MGATVNLTVYMGTKVNPMDFEITKVDPFKVGELLSIL